MTTEETVDIANFAKVTADLDAILFRSAAERKPSPQEATERSAA
jgi:hypothetical protein